jgi:hypothetical protein
MTAGGIVHLQSWVEQSKMNLRQVVANSCNRIQRWYPEIVDSVKTLLTSVGEKVR